VQRSVSRHSRPWDREGTTHVQRCEFAGHIGSVSSCNWKYREMHRTLASDKCEGIQKKRPRHPVYKLHLGWKCRGDILRPSTRPKQDLRGAIQNRACSTSSLPAQYSGWRGLWISCPLAFELKLLSGDEQIYPCGHTRMVFEIPSLSPESGMYRYLKAI